MLQDVEETAVRRLPCSPYNHIDIVITGVLPVMRGLNARRCVRSTLIKSITGLDINVI